ncbi:MAG: hypothetical protein JOY69_03460 [Candidatus Eremiobacteraeota bacterium]|nr:hypothetical protein [Candidatus Eremiobacteraeota bacterium]MBV8372294.1 hypothetical protein [Candidatus Eremiobacteraeota bacterium]
MKYVFVQLFPALNETRPAARTGAEDFDAFDVDAARPSEAVTDETDEVASVTS